MVDMAVFDSTSCVPPAGMLPFDLAVFEEAEDGEINEEVAALEEVLQQMYEGEPSLLDTCVIRVFAC